jgi:hypothetical protein
MKYKLIKTYPGSHKLGHIIAPQLDNGYYVNSNWIQPENHPEFWQLVVEKDYEILSYQGKETSNIYNITNNGTYNSASSQITVGNNLIPNYYNIYSVKRLSDGEIFTIGDKVNFNKKCKSSTYPINMLLEIKLINNIIYLENSKNIWSNELDQCLKLIQPLFTTEDGVDIFENDEDVYYIDLKNLKDVKLSSPTICSTSQKSDYIFYKSKEKAEKYIFMNKPCLSLKDVANIYISADKPITDTTSFSAQNRRIQELVKQKLK